MAKKDNTLYNCCSPLRLTELQESELEKHAKDSGITVNQAVRDALYEQGIVTAGPEPKARKGCGKKAAA